jgi:hypothetical protein
VVLVHTSKLDCNKSLGTGHGGSIENGPTTMKFLTPKNRSKSLSLYHCTDQEKEDLNLMFDQARVIIAVTNKIGKINCQKFNEYVQNAYKHWITAFGKFVDIKSSIHWTMAHVSTLIARNGSYTLAEISENSIEKWIKPYRVVTDKNARQGSMQENNIDCLKYFYIQSRHDIRKFDKVKKSKKENDDISKLIDSFFILNEDGKVWSFAG